MPHTCHNSRAFFSLNYIPILMPDICNPSLRLAQSKEEISASFLPKHQTTTTRTTDGKDCVENVKNGEGGHVQSEGGVRSKEMPTPRPSCTNRRHRSSAHVAPVTARHARKTRAAQREQEENGTHQQETVGSTWNSRR